MKINIAKKHMLNFFGFTVHPGMILGYDENNCAFVSNGKIDMRDESVAVYFLEGQQLDGKYAWSAAKRIKRHNRQRFVDAIAAKALRQIDGVKYLTTAEREVEYFGRKEFENKSVLFNGCQTKHYYYNVKKIAC